MIGVQFQLLQHIVAAQPAAVVCKLGIGLDQPAFIAGVDGVEAVVRQFDHPRIAFDGKAVRQIRPCHSGFAGGLQVSHMLFDRTDRPLKPCFAYRWADYGMGILVKLNMAASAETMSVITAAPHHAVVDCTHLHQGGQVGYTVGI
ncbi:Uncharacterised protein [Neisseria sicca]|nr:Uncharacterised protein [Neisseria sicca]